MVSSSQHIMNHIMSKSKRIGKSSKAVRKRRREVARDAAIRTLNGNGSSPNLPPLPSGDDGSLGTLLSHRYGAQPYGNIYIAEESSSSKDEVRQHGLGNMLGSLNDEQVLSVLQFLDGETLSRVVQCSRFLYVAGHHDDLWRDITLRKFGSKGFTFVKTWKDTFISTESKSKAIDRYELFKSHVPIKMKNIYSDIFYRSWLCGTFNIDESWLSINNVRTEASESLTIKKFLEYEESNTPLLIKGATCNWPAIQKWNKEYLTSQTKGFYFRATSGAAPLPAKFTVEDYIKYCDGVSEEAPLYLFDRTFAKKCPVLLNDYQYSLKKTCPFFDDQAEHGHDLFSLLGKEKRPDHRWLIIGPKRSFSNFHIDPNATHAWNAPIMGRKRWIFYPPGINPPGVYPSPNGDDVVMPISLGEWFLTHFNDHVKERSNPDISKRPLECTVEPGDILFVPHGWWHAVLNLDDGISVALTQNYVSKSNLPDVLRFLETKQQQISGCRDRAEAIQPENLLQEFKQRLRDSRPDLLHEAQKRASCGWYCTAWTDVERKKKKVKKESTSILLKAKTPNNSEVMVQKVDHNETVKSAGFTFSFM